MADEKDLAFPRVVYRGDEDPLGEGKGESKSVHDADAWAQAKKDGWRLERDPKHHAAHADDPLPADKDSAPAPDRGSAPVRNALKK